MGTAHARVAAANVALAVPAAALAVIGHARQGGRLPPVAGAQFGQLAEHDGDGGRADAGQGVQCGGALVHGFVGLQLLGGGRLQVGEEFDQTALQAGRLQPQIGIQQTFGLVAFGEPGRLELAAALHQGGQAALGPGVRGGGRGLLGTDEGREDAFIAGIGLGPLARRAGEQAHAQRVGDRDGKAGLVEGGDEGAPVAPEASSTTWTPGNPAQGAVTAVA